MMGRTVDAVIAAMEANHPDLTNQKTLYVKISGTRDAERTNEATQAMERRTPGKERTRSQRLMEI